MTCILNSRKKATPVCKEGRVQKKTGRGGGIPVPSGEKKKSEKGQKKKKKKRDPATPTRARNREKKRENEENSLGESIFTGKKRISCSSATREEWRRGSEQKTRQKGLQT